MRYLVTTLLMLGPRLAILVWCADPGRIRLTFEGWPQPAALAFPPLVWPLAGAVLFPWTTWAYLMVVGEGVTGPEWLGLGLGLLIDVGAHAVNLYPRRGAMPLVRAVERESRQSDQ